MAVSWIIAFAPCQVTLTDFVFTGGGVALITITGFANSTLQHIDLLSKLWIGIGTLATVLPLINVYWMVCKPT